MNALGWLVLLSALTPLVVLILARTRMVGWVHAGLLGVQLLLLLAMTGPVIGGATVPGWTLSVMGWQLQWRLDASGWFFALITLGAALASTCYAAGEWGERHRAAGGRLGLLHASVALNVFAMLMLLLSGDLISLFLGWELVSWASYLLMLVAGGVARETAMRYITYAMVGAMAIFAGVVLLLQQAGTPDFAAVIAVVPRLGSGELGLLVLLFASGFGVKMGLLPFHLWQAGAYAETPGPGAAFLGAISSRMGLFAILVVLVKLIGIARLDALSLGQLPVDARDLLAWVAVFTIIFPTYTAMRQNDARYLLAWHGIGQGGYMLLGIILGDALGSAGGILHVFNYASCQAALFLAVTAVVHRTGTADLNRLGGLVVRMPLTFLTLLIGIIGLAGLPPMNGFVSKWMIYRDLIEQGRPLLFLGTVIGTLGTILSVYKLIHNMFLGQLRLEHDKVHEAPWSMLAPMLVLATVILLSGVMPGIPLAWVAAVQEAVGLPVLQSTLGGVDRAGGSLDMLWVFGVMLYGFGIGALLFYGAGRAKRVHQLDNYAGGHFLSSDVRYQYSDNFYAGLMRLIGGWYRGSFAWAERAIASLVDFASVLMQALYRRANGEAWAMLASVLLLWVVV